MPNIFKQFLGPIQSYVFPKADELAVDDLLPPEEAEEETQPAEGEEGAQAAGEQSEDQAVLSFAQVQADEIVAQARKEGEALLEQYRQQAAQELEEAREAARQEGFQEGYAQGMAQAQEEGKAAAQETLRRQGEQVKEFLEQATRAREDLMEQTKSELCDLSMAVAEKIIHISLKSSQDVILRMIQMATQRLRRREWVHIYVGGCDARQLAQITPELTTSLASLSDHIKVIPMANDESGTCIIEMPDEIIDASASTQLNNLRDILHSS